MIQYENDCCDCATPSYPCNGMHKHVPHLYCDKCGADVDFIYEVDGEHICEACLPTMFEEKTVEDLI